jgi:aryl-alcohol dehydrogenase-like predicted oxidoreductase
MITSTWKDKQLSRLMLGTVQLGMPYGVANRTGQPSFSDVVAILATALEGGVNCFDTAAAYGTSEEVLGRALRELGVLDRVTIVTKVRALNPIELADPVLATRAIEQSVSESRRRLQLDRLPVVLFHREADARFGNVLEELRGRGWLGHYGVSCDNRPGPAAEFVRDGNFSALQLPGNILDNRHLQSGVFQMAAARGVAVFVRSVYLQGLLLMLDNEIPLALQPVIPARRRLASLAQNAGMSLAELALRYMLSQKEVTCVITGVETAQQVHDNLAMFNRGPLPSDLLNALNAGSPDLPQLIITPNMWPPKETV